MQEEGLRGKLSKERCRITYERSTVLEKDKFINLKE